MKILVANPLVPYPEHSIRAANVVIYEMLCALARKPGVQAGFLKVDEAGTVPLTDPEKAGLEKLRAQGVDILEPLRLPPMSAPQAARLDDITLAHFYPQIACRPAATQAALDWGADVVLIPWSEPVTALFADFPGLKFAYYGNPDHTIRVARAFLNRDLMGDKQGFPGAMAVAGKLEGLHREQMLRFEFVGSVSANFAAYYTGIGHPNAFYIQNMWPNRFASSWQALREAKEVTEGPARIVANVGKLSATGNSFGLAFLTHLVPELRRAFAGRPFELHIFGAQDPLPRIAQGLAGFPEILRRGFVDDIDGEILAAPVFLCTNNAYPSVFSAGHTRYLHAWELGGCVVAHQAASDSMPEIVHEGNALLGGDAREIADAIVRAFSDRDLRRRLGTAGHATLTDSFSSDHVAETIVRRLGG